MASSQDGDTWLELQTCTQPNVTFWRPRTYHGMHYVAAYSDAGRDEMDGWSSRLLRSRDGVQWEDVSVIHWGQGANETSLDFAADGMLTALVRRMKGPRFPTICLACPPFEEFDCTSAQRFLQGPLLERIGHQLLVMGCCREGEEMRTGWFWPRGSRLDLIDLLPSGGSTSYAALAQTGETTWLLSYYSTHEVDTGSRGKSSIYLAKLAQE